jgi:hypothetical protein
MSAMRVWLQLPVSSFLGHVVFQRFYLSGLCADQAGSGNRVRETVLIRKVRVSRFARLQLFAALP